MLTVATPSSGTEAEHAAHRLFTQWDTGVRVLGGVAAFRPYDEPGTKRRQSDVVLLVPDGVIVVRLVGSQRQTGPIVAHPRGAWSIGGEVLRIIGGGSNPLPALREAQAAVASTLRANGLEPGRVAMLVAVGAGEPVEPTDGQLDDGVVACPLSDEGLAIGIRRAAALAAAADVRQWTTADVKAALTCLEASGRVPAVEELNSEGFMYSPYILRRPDLVAAATAVAAASATDSDAAQPTHVAPDEVHEVGPATQVAVDGQSSGDTDEGLAGIFGSDPPPVRAPYPTPDAPASPWPDPIGSGRSGRYGDGTDADGGHGDDARGRRRVLRVVAALAVLLLLGAAVYVGFGLLSSDDTDVGGDPPSVAPTSVEQTSTPGASTQQIGDYTYVPAVSRDGETCTGNADGDVAEYFDTTDCASLVRELYTSDIDDVQVLVSVARVTMPDQASAEEFKSLVDSDGTGNVDDLLEAGERIENGPTELVPAAYSSDLDGEVLTIIVAGWLDPSDPGDEQALEQLVTEALALEPPA